MEPVISLQNISKVYSAPGDSFIPEGKLVNALSNVTIDVARGERIALIGSNGSGKTTLLSILAGLVKPTSGTATIQGKILSILDIGAGFVPELTGRENAAFHLRLHLSKKHHTNEVLKAIQEFSELGSFFDMPIKTYSKGMLLRLAFATNYHLDGDIYLIDEVLNVGDESFRLKISHLFEQLTGQQKTVLLATHSTQEIMKYCNKCVWIEAGKVKEIGIPESVIPLYNRYQRIKHETTSKWHKNTIAKVIEPNMGRDDNELTGQEGEFQNEVLAIERLVIMANHDNGVILKEKPISIKLHLFKKNIDDTLSVQFKIRDEFDTPALYLTSISNIQSDHLDDVTRGYSGRLEYTCEIPANLLGTGYYYLTTAIGRNVNLKQPAQNERGYFLPCEIGFRVQSILPQIMYESKNYPIQPYVLWQVKLNT